MWHRSGDDVDPYSRRHCSLTSSPLNRPAAFVRTQKPCGPLSHEKTQKPVRSNAPNIKENTLFLQGKKNPPLGERSIH
jgi:hypothetical protein